MRSGTAAQTQTDPVAFATGSVSVERVSAASADTEWYVGYVALVGGFRGRFDSRFAGVLLVGDEIDAIQGLPTLRWSRNCEALTDIVFGADREPESAAQWNPRPWISNSIANLSECDAAELDSVLRLLLSIPDLPARRPSIGCGLIARTPSSTTHLRIRSAYTAASALRQRTQRSITAENSMIYPEGSPLFLPIIRYATLPARGSA